MAKKKKVIGKTVAGIGKIVLSVFENMVLGKINNDDLKQGIKTLLVPLKGSLTVLSDNNPDDKKQMEQVWLEFLRSQELSNYTESQLQELIDKIQIESVRQGLRRLVLPAVRMFQALINTDPNNIQEIERIWLEFLRSESLREYISSEVNKLIAFIKHEQLRESLELIVKPVLNTLSALVDTDLNNKEQLEKLWLQFLSSEELSLFALKNIKTWMINLGADEFLVETVVMFIESTLDDLLNREEDTANT